MDCIAIHLCLPMLGARSDVHDSDRTTAIASDASSHHVHAACTELQIHLNLAGGAIGLRIPVSR